MELRSYKHHLDAVDILSHVCALMQWNAFQDADATFLLLQRPLTGAAKWALYTVGDSEEQCLKPCKCSSPFTRR